VKFKIGDKVIYKTGTPEEDRGEVVDYYEKDDTRIWVVWEGEQQDFKKKFCRVENLQLDIVATSPLVKALE
jgi:hypothetical protein